MDASISTSFYQQVHDKINTKSCDQLQVFNKTYDGLMFFSQVQLLFFSMKSHMIIAGQFVTRSRFEALSL